MQIKTDIIKLIQDKNSNALFADGLDAAVIGMTDSSEPVPIYDKQKCVEVMMNKEGWDYSTALEFLEFNTFCAYVGIHTPLFVWMPTADC